MGYRWFGYGVWVFMDSAIMKLDGMVFSQRRLLGMMIRIWIWGLQLGCRYWVLTGPVRLDL